MSYIDEHLEFLARHEGTKGAKTRVEDKTKAAAPFGLDNPPIPRKNNESDKAYAKRVLEYFDAEATAVLGDSYNRAPKNVKRAVLDSYYNSGRLYPGQINSLKNNDYLGFARNTLDIVSANDPQTGGSGVLKGLANRRAETYNLMADDVKGLSRITGGELQNIDGKARLIYQTEKEPISFDFQKPLHSSSKVGNLNVLGSQQVQPEQSWYDKGLGAIQQFRNYLGFNEGGSVSEPLNLSDKARGILNLDLGARMSKERADYWTQKPNEFRLLKKLSDINPSNGMERLLKLIGTRSLGLGYKKGGKVKNKTTNVIDVSADRLPYDRLQEIARRSMMQGDYEDRMADYDQARFEARRPFAERYPVDRTTGQGAYSTAAPMGMQAQRMMGFANGGMVDNAQNLASLGRGGDSMLVHMQPQEVQGLQSLAQANGTSLTRNPYTGMPEAFSLGGVFKAALPIAAGYFTGGTGTSLFGLGQTGSAIAAGALTGAGISALTGGDILADTLSGGLGGVTGAGLNTALMGPAQAATATETAAATAPLSNVAGTMPQAAAGTYNPALSSSLTTSGGGAAALQQGSVFNQSLNPGASFYDKVATNLGTPETIAATAKDFTRIDPTTGQLLKETGKIAPASPLQVGMKLGAPVATSLMGGLEPSDFESDFSPDRSAEAYDPNKRLNLTMDTGIGAALKRDTGLRLMASGGTVSASGPPSAPKGFLQNFIHRQFTQPGMFKDASGNPSEMSYVDILRQKGIINYGQGGYLDGGRIGDGMSDSVRANIDGQQEARLSEGEFVVPADVVSHLGNGSSDAGAQRLYSMMDRVRKARTGTKKQGREINPERYMPT